MPLINYRIRTFTAGNIFVSLAFCRQILTIGLYGFPQIQKITVIISDHLEKLDFSSFNFGTGIRNSVIRSQFPP